MRLRRKAFRPQPEKTENDVSPDESDGEIGAGGKAAHEPEKQSLGLIEINDRIKKHNYGGDEGVENHSGQQQVIRVKATVEQRKTINQHHAQQRAEKGDERHPRDFPQKPAGDGQQPVREKDQTQDSTQRRAAGNSNHLRAGQRIAQQRLQHDAASGHAAADGDSQKNSRKPGAKKYFGFRVGGEYISQSLRQIEAHRSEQGATDNG